MTQRERIVDYVRKNGSITALEAEQAFGCMRLASRMSELRKHYDVRCIVENGKNRYGEPIHWKRYYIEEEK